MKNNTSSNRLPLETIIKGLATFLFLIGIMYVLRHVFYVFFILFGGTLFAIFLNGISDFLKDLTNMSRDWALGFTIIILLATLGLTGWLAGSSIASQISELIKRFPQAMTIIRDYLSNYVWGRSLLDSFPELQELLPAGKGLIGNVTGFFTTIVGAFTGIILVFFVGIYLAIEPDLYIEGFLHLFPSEKKSRAREVLGAIERALRWWLLGRSASMVAVGLLTMTGLLIIGLPLAPSLGLISGLLTFIPFIGPWLSIAPALMVGLVEGPMMILSVIMVYIVVQQLENHLITPIVQKEAVFIPPVLLVTAQTLIGILFGLIGILLATPLAIVMMILVQMLYVEDVLDEQIRVLGAHSRE